MYRNHEKHINGFRGLPVRNTQIDAMVAFSAVVLWALLLSACAPVVSPLYGTQATTEPTLTIEPSNTTFVDSPFASQARMSSTLGYSVLNHTGDRVGQIEDYLLDITTGQTLYAVVSFDVYPALAGELFPMPFEFLDVNTSDASLFADLSEQALAGAPRYTPGSFDGMTANIALNSGIRTYWQNVGLATPQMWRGLQQQPVVLPFYRYGTGIRMFPGTVVQFTNWMQQEITDGQGVRIGQPQDLVFDRQTGEVRYVVVLVSDEVLPAEAILQGTMTILPVGVLTWNTQENTLTFDAEQTALADAPRFLLAEWPDLTDSTLNLDVQDYWFGQMPAAALRAGARVLPEDVMRADAVLNRDVTSPTGDDLGVLEDMIVDLDDGQLVYAVLDLSGIFDLDGQYRVVPANSLALDSAVGAALLAVDRNALEESPVLDSSKLAEFVDAGWQTRFQEYWQDWVMPPGVETSESPEDVNVQVIPGFATVDTVKEYTVQNIEGEDLGNVEELVLNLSQGKVAYAVLSFGGILGLGDKLFAVPMDLLTPDLDVDNSTLLFNVSRAQLEEMPGFPSDNWPDVHNPQWRQAVSQYWMDQPTSD